MPKIIVLVLVSVLAMAGVLGPCGVAQAACKGPPAGYAGWGTAAFAPGDGRTVSPDGMVLTAKKQAFATWIANATVIDATFCVTFKVPDDVAATTLFGFVFWQQDADNFYIAVINAGATVSVYEHVKNAYTQNQAKWQFVKSDRLSPFYVNGPQPPLLATATPGKADSGYNELAMIVLGDQARIFVNGHQVSVVGAEQLYGRTSAGLYIESDADKDAAVHIQSVAISSLCSHGESSGYCS